MIYGIGTDICDVRRIRASLERHGERFAQRILCAGELDIWRTRTARHAPHGVRYLAMRFSAKEAFSKAIGMGMHWPMSWRNCEVVNQSSGRPGLVLHGELRQWFETRRLQAHISLTDESDYVVTFAVVEQLVEQAGQGG